MVNPPVSTGSPVRWRSRQSSSQTKKVAYNKHDAIWIDETVNMRKYLENFVSHLKIIVEDVQKSATSSDLAGTYFYPIARQLDNHLIRTEIWISDIIEEDPSLVKLKSDHMTSLYIEDTIRDIVSQVADVEIDMEKIHSELEKMSSNPMTNIKRHHRLKKLASLIESQIEAIAISIRGVVSTTDIFQMQKAVKAKEGVLSGSRSSVRKERGSIALDNELSLEISSKGHSQRVITGNQSLPSKYEARSSASQTTIQTEVTNDSIATSITKPDTRMVLPRSQELTGTELFWYEQGKRSRFGNVTGGNVSPTEDTKNLSIAEDPRYELHRSRGPKMDLSQSNEKTGLPPLVEKDPWAKKTLLAFDGGGIRGYSSLLILQQLMNSIEALEKERDSNVETSAHPLDIRGSSRQEHRSANRFLPCHYFDYIAGSSTGGLIAIMLGRLRMSVDDCIKAYQQLGQKIFSNPRRLHRRNISVLPRVKYDHMYLEQAIRDIVQQFSSNHNSDTPLRQPNEDMCRTIVWAWRKHDDSEKSEPYLFPSYVPQKEEYKQLEDLTIWQAGRAAAAAPSYFKSMKLGEADGKSRKYIDGGFGSHNPSEETCRAVSQSNDDYTQSIGYLLSIGAGINSEDFSRTSKASDRRLIADVWTWRSKYTHLVMSNSSIGNDCYSRLDVGPYMENIKLDNWKGETGHITIDEIREKTQRWLQTPITKTALKATAETLVAVRRMRSNFPDRARWERFCYGIEYTCAVIDCKEDQTWQMRADLRRHLESSHPQHLHHIESLLDQGKRFTAGY